jgi:hypothetical protein
LEPAQRAIKSAVYRKQGKVTFIDASKPAIFSSNEEDKWQKLHDRREILRQSMQQN